MRFFIALDIPEESKKQLQSLQQKIKQLVPQASLTDADKLHLTIAFIGDRPDSFKIDLTRAISASTRDIPAFEVTPAFLDGFPHLHTAHILWVGVKGDIDKLYLLRHRIKDQLAELNLEVDERRYVPHIAIAKVNKFNITKAQEEAFQQLMQQEFEPIVVSSVKLFESIPDHGFHSHNTLTEIKLS